MSFLTGLVVGPTRDETESQFLQIGLSSGLSGIVCSGKEPLEDLNDEYVVCATQFAV